MYIIECVQRGTSGCGTVCLHRLSGFIECILQGCVKNPSDVLNSSHIASGTYERGFDPACCSYFWNHNY